MQKIQAQTELDIHAKLQQLKTSELEVFAREAAMILTERKTKDKKIREVELLQKLNEEPKFWLSMKPNKQEICLI